MPGAPRRRGRPRGPGRRPLRSGSVNRAVPAPTCSASACRSGAAPGGEGVPDRQRDAVLEADLVADGVDHPVDPGHPVLRPPLPRHRVGAGEPGQPQHGPLDGDGGVPVGQVDHRLRGQGGELPRPRHQRGVEVRCSRLPLATDFRAEVVTSRFRAEILLVVMGGLRSGRRRRAGARQAGRARSPRTADRVSVVAQRARCGGCADGQRAGRVLGADGVPAAVGGGVEGVERAQPGAGRCGGRRRRARRPTGRAG